MRMSTPPVQLSAGLGKWYPGPVHAITSVRRLKAFGYGVPWRPLPNGPTIAYRRRGKELRVLQEPPTVAPSATQLKPAVRISAATTTEQYNWTEHWYPLVPVADLDPTRPRQFHLLGQSLAVWCDAAGDWHAVEDRCPHRLAPLSEGRIQDGELQCAYHGWQFNGQGSCTRVPQIADSGARQAACANPRAAAASFPTKVCHDLLWVYGSSSPEAWRLALATAADPPDLAYAELLPGNPAAENIFQRTHWFVRDLPLRYDTLVENVVDPSHVPYAHHGVQGNRNKAGGIAVAVRSGPDQKGFACEVSRTGGPPGTSSTLHFVAPNKLWYDSSFGGLQIYVYPTKPGWSRIAVTMLGRKNAKPFMKPWQNAVFRFIETTPALEHPIMRHPVLDGDTYMLHVLERLQAEKAGTDKARYYTPGSADGAVIAWRTWLKRYAGEVPTCERGVPLIPELPREVVLDRYSQHTKDCPSCSKGLKWADRVSMAAGAVSALAVVALVAGWAAGRPMLQLSTLGGAILAVAAAAVCIAMRRFRTLYVFTDYVHADKK